MRKIRSFLFACHLFKDAVSRLENKASNSNTIKVD